MSTTPSKITRPATKIPFPRSESSSDSESQRHKRIRQEGDDDEVDDWSVFMDQLKRKESLRQLQRIKVKSEREIKKTKK
jgi:hypothetical protein